MNTHGLRVDLGDRLYKSQRAVEINGNGRFLVFLNTNSNGFYYNGRLGYFQIERTSVNNPMNSILNCSFGNTGSLFDVNYVDITNQANNPVMLSSYEYLIGDAEGNAIIDARDATLILTQTVSPSSILL